MGGWIQDIGMQPTVKGADEMGIVTAWEKLEYSLLYHVSRVVRKCENGHALMTPLSCSHRISRF
jgi:hypothetical protein